MTRIAKCVQELPEIYQPVYGHPKLSGKVSRPCVDRLQDIVKVHEALKKALGRPLNVLDLGCAQGFFSFSLAERGAIVHGVDYLDKNIALCNAIAEEHPDFKVSFETGRVEEIIERLEKDQYDLVLGLSVFHHIIHEKGVDPVKALLERAAACSGVLVIESALKEEPLYWAPAQPEDPRLLFEKIAFVHELARHGTHLAPVPRPLYAASNRYWVLGDHAGAFETWTEDPHAFALGTHEGSRRYFFSPAYVVKLYRFDHRRGEHNRQEFNQAFKFFANVPEGFPVAVCLASGSNDTEGWTVLERKSGRLLLDLLREGAELDRMAILRSVLHQLVLLESSGLYHNDVRVWNVLVEKDGAAYLIDYGSISTQENDCMWPENRFLSFLIFVHELTTGVIDPPDALRNITITPHTLPRPYRQWGLALWKRPLRDWSFKMMYETLDSLPKQSKNGDPEQPADVWAGAIEEALEIQRQSVRHLKKRIETGEHWPKEVSSALERMEAVMAEAQAGAVARAADSEARRQEAEARSQKAESRADQSEGRAQKAESRAQKVEERLRRAEEEILLHQSGVGVQEVVAGIKLQQLEISVQQAEARSQEAEVRAQEADGRAQRAEVRAQEAEARSQEAEGRAQDAESKAQRAEVRAQQSAGLLRAASEAQQARIKAEERAQSAEGREQGAESRRQEAEVRAQRAEDRSQEAEVRAQKAEGRSQEAEVRAQKAEGRSQESEIRAQKAERELHERMTDLVGVQAKVSEVQQELAQVKAEYEVLRTANHLQRVQANEKEARIEGLTAELNTLKADHHVLLEANHINWMQANERQAQIEEMMKSLSWRCAAPVRWAGVQWRRLRGEGFVSRLRALVKKILRFVIPKKIHGWLRIQWHRLRNEGLLSRFKALVKKILRCPLRRAVEFIDRHPVWRFRVIGLAHRLRIHSCLKRIYWRGKGKDGALSQMSSGQLIRINSVPENSVSEKSDSDGGSVFSSSFRIGERAMTPLEKFFRNELKH